MGFTGIINTVLVALVISLATSEDARSILSTSPYYNELLAVAGLGFFFFILTTVLSLLAFREEVWMRVPDMPDKDPLDSIEFFYSDPHNYNPKWFARQLVQATEFHQKTNDSKFRYLRRAQISLVFGIALSSLGWFLMLLTSA